MLMYMFLIHMADMMVDHLLNPLHTLHISWHDIHERGHDHETQQTNITNLVYHNQVYMNIQLHLNLILILLDIRHMILYLYPSNHPSISTMYDMQDARGVVWCGRVLVHTSSYKVFIVTR
jgi:hypothetical protein